MHTDKTAIWGAGVLSNLAFEKRFYSLFLDLIQIVQPTHCVLCPVPGVQLSESLTWHIRAVIIEMRRAVPDGLAVFDNAGLTVISGLVGMDTPKIEEPISMYVQDIDDINNNLDK